MSHQAKAVGNACNRLISAGILSSDQLANERQKLIKRSWIAQRANRILGNLMWPAILSSLFIPIEWGAIGGLSYMLAYFTATRMDTVFERRLRAIEVVPDWDWRIMQLTKLPPALRAPMVMELGGAIAQAGRLPVEIEAAAMYLDQKLWLSHRAAR